MKRTGKRLSPCWTPQYFGFLRVFSIIPVLGPFLEREKIRTEVYRRFLTGYQYILLPTVSYSRPSTTGLSKTREHTASTMKIGALPPKIVKNIFLTDFLSEI
jgi:hypothetical protein